MVFGKFTFRRPFFVACIRKRWPVVCFHTEVKSFLEIDSYQDAWVNFSAAAWRNIILNICMFVPFGVLLPSCIKSCQSWWKTYLAGFVFTVGIESVQLVARRGLFELDDIMGNTVGAMIGYGIFALGICAWQIRYYLHLELL